MQQDSAHKEVSYLYPDITHTAGIVNGSPRIESRLLSVREIVSAVRDQGLHKVLADYFLTVSQIMHALQYCSDRQCTKDAQAELCTSCSLRKQQKGRLDTSEFEEITFNKTTYVRGNDSLFLGTLSELLADWNGEDWWVIATDLLIDYRKDLFS